MTEDSFLGKTGLEAENKEGYRKEGGVQKRVKALEPEDP